jgi:hypothetical protein
LVGLRPLRLSSSAASAYKAVETILAQLGERTRRREAAGRTIDPTFYNEWKNPASKASPAEAMLGSIAFTTKFTKGRKYLFRTSCYLCRRGETSH